MTTIAIPRRPRRLPLALALVWLLLAWAAPASAQDAANQDSRSKDSDTRDPFPTDDDFDDNFLDPLAFARVDPAAESVPITVKNQATDETRQVMGRYLLADSREMYLRSSVLASVLKAGRYWQEKLRHLDLKVGTRSFRVTGGSRLVISDEGQVLLPVPVLDHEGDLWLPVTLLERVIGPQTQEPVRWDAAQRSLELGNTEFTVTRLAVEVLGRSTAVHIGCTQSLGFQASSPRAGIIEVKIYAGEVDARAVSQGAPRGLLRSASSRQLRDHALVTLNVDQLVGRYRTYAADEGREIVVVLEEEAVSAMPDPVPLGRADLNIKQTPVDVTKRARVRTVVVDPGHGGHEMGAVGQQGIMEKDVNLGVARELRRYLEQESDLRVVLTRSDDSHVDLAERAEIGNAANGDVFLSLHCNNWFNSATHGLETYFLSPAKSDWAKSVEAAENRTSGSANEPDDVAFIVWELVQNQFISSSSRLAETVQAEVAGALDLPDRGVRQAGFRVLVGAYMPAVLIEMGFLSNAEEERRLGDRNYQRQLARAIGDAVLSYSRQSRRGGAGGGNR